jgi:retinol dehydrogenase-12
MESHYDDRYNSSKLLQIYIIRKLPAVVDPSMTPKPHSIVINAMDSMFYKCYLGSEGTDGSRAFGSIFKTPTARITEEGSRLIVQAASAGRETTACICVLMR